LLSQIDHSIHCLVYHYFPHCMYICHSTIYCHFDLIFIFDFPVAVTFESLAPTSLGNIQPFFLQLHHFTCVISFDSLLSISSDVFLSASCFPFDFLLLPFLPFWPHSNVIKKSMLLLMQFSLSCL
jgi:hypothetical protein